MNELNIQTKQGEITTNLEALKTELAEIADRYEGVVVSEDTVPQAKKDLAELRKVRTDIEDRRKAIKKQWNEPYNAFEEEVKTALKIIDKPIGEIDKQVKDFETAERGQKKEECRKIYADSVGDEYKSYLPFESVFNEKWLNKSYKPQEIQADISEKTTQIRADLDAIRALNSEIEEECLEAYKTAGNSLTAAIKRNADYISAKQLAEQKAREEKAKEEVKEEPIEMPIPEGFEAVDDTLRIEIVGLENIDKVKQFLEFSEIEYKEI